MSQILKFQDFISLFWGSLVTPPLISLPHSLPGHSFPLPFHICSHLSCLCMDGNIVTPPQVNPSSGLFP